MGQALPCSAMLNEVALKRFVTLPAFHAKKKGTPRRPSRCMVVSRREARCRTPRRRTQCGQGHIVFLCPVMQPVKALERQQIVKFHMTSFHARWRTTGNRCQRRKNVPVPCEAKRGWKVLFW